MRAKLAIHYDRKRDVLYVTRGKGNTLNLSWKNNEDVRLDPTHCEFVGYIITNFSTEYPKLAERLRPKDRWFVKDFFAQRLDDWNLLLAPAKEKRSQWLRAIRVRLSTPSHFAAH